MLEESYVQAKKVVESLYTSVAEVQKKEMIKKVKELIDGKAKFRRTRMDWVVLSNSIRTFFEWFKLERRGSFWVWFDSTTTIAQIRQVLKDWTRDFENIRQVITDTDWKITEAKVRDYIKEQLDYWILMQFH